MHSDFLITLYFARLDARIVLARDHLHEVDFKVSKVPRQSRARVNSKSYAIYELPRHSAMHKCFASRWLRLSLIYLIKYCGYGTKQYVVLLPQLVVILILNLLQIRNAEEIIFLCMLELVNCRYGSHELIAHNCEANQAGLKPFIICMIN